MRSKNCGTIDLIDCISWYDCTNHIVYPIILCIFYCIINGRYYWSYYGSYPVLFLFWNELLEWVCRMQVWMLVRRMQEKVTGNAVLALLCATLILLMHSHTEFLPSRHSVCPSYLIAILSPRYSRPLKNQNGFWLLDLIPLSHLAQ